MAGEYCQLDDKFGWFSGIRPPTSPRSVQVLLQIQLPRDAVAVIDPCELATEPVFAERHEREPSVREARVKPLNFRFRFAVHEEGECWREGEVVFHDAVGTHHRLTSDGEGRLHDRSFGAGPAWTMTDGVDDHATSEQRDVEVHRLFGLTLKHEKGSNLRAHSFVTYRQFNEAAKSATAP